MSAITQPIKYHGGKSYLADWIISLMPPRCKNPNKPDPKDKGWLHYVEPYFGGGAVLLAQDPEGISECVNDLNTMLTMFWRVLQSPNDFINLRRKLDATPFSKELYERSVKAVAGMNGYQLFYWERAFHFFVHARQSLSGRQNGFASITRNRTRRGMNEQASAWLGAIEGLEAVHKRLKRVVILDGEATDVIRQQDGLRTLFYLDPPYMQESRASKGEYGEHEMSDEQHKELLEVLVNIKGRFLLSGYPSKLYASYAKMQGWTCHEKKIDNKAAGGKTKRRMTECVWTNF